MYVTIQYFYQNSLPVHRRSEHEIEYAGSSHHENKYQHISFKKRDVLVSVISSA